jgi:NADH:ubiquinone oxidoreductase subunit 6 (subunit J)
MLPLIAIALVTLTAAAVAMSLRNLIHSALLLIASWAGIAAFYLWAGAEFVAFAQVLVYVGAVSMIVLFAVLLTRRSRLDITIAPDSITRAIGGLIVGGAVLGVLFGAVIGTNLPSYRTGTATTTVRQLGTQLMNAHLAGVLIVGVILTLALLGAVVLAANDRDYTKEGKE